MGFLDSLGETLKSLGGAAAAPVGLAIDLASMPFDDKDDNFGSILSATAHAGGGLLDPLTNDSTWTGYSFGKVMHGLSWTYEEAVDRPIGTATTMAGHALVSGDIGSVFNSEDWAQAYKVAKDRSLGQAATMNQLATMGQLLGGGSDDASLDPLREDSWKSLKDKSGAGPVLEGMAITADLTAAWYLDPGVLLGKAASVARKTNLGKLKPLDRLDFEEKMAGTAASTGVRSQDWSGRFNDYFDYVSGNNHLKRKLNAAEIFSASPELQRSAQGKAIAGLMDDALKIEDEQASRTALRRIFAVGAGDPTQIDRLRREAKGAEAIADALSNIAESTTPRLHLQALKDVRLDPEFNAEFSRQLDNLNTDGEIDAFVETWGKKVQDKLDGNSQMLSVQGDLNFVPGKHGITGDRALRRQAGENLGAKVSGAHDKTIAWAKDLANRESYSSVFQKSIYHMPLVVAHPVGLLATPYTKFVPGAVGALRQTHFTGVVNLHDWNGATTQLDSMMRIAGVDDARRTKLLSGAYKASSEADKVKAIHAVETVSTNALAEQMSLKVGRKIDAGFIQEITARGQMARQGSAARTDGGRIYGATAAPDEMADDLTQWAASKADSETATPGSWRVDQIPDESGLPMAMPLTVSQLGNRVPLFDIALAKKLTKDQSWVERFSKLSDAYVSEARDLKGLQAQIRRTGASATSTLGKAVVAKRASLDALSHAGSIMTRWWKYSVLMRLGYPMRVLMDDHMRIASQMHWSSFALGSLREGIGNGLYNNAPAMIYSGGRKAAARQAMTVARGRRRELTTVFGREAHTDEEWASLKTAIADMNGKGVADDVRAKARKIVSELDPDGRVAEHFSTVREAQSLASQVSGHKAAIARWKAQLSEAETKRSLGFDGGDTSTLHRKIQEAEAAIADKEAGRSFLLEQLGDDPETLRKELLGLNRAIDGGIKSFADPKRHIGMNPVKLDERLAASGVYGPRGGMYRAEAGSQESYSQLLTDGEESTFGLLSSGAHRTIGPQEPGHLHVWANVLNHQFQNSPELMAFVRGKVSTPREFAQWLKEPEQAYIRDRMRHFAADPEDWGSRLQELAQDYVPTPELREALIDGSVSARKLARMFPDADARPVVHGQLANVNAGRHMATRMFSDGINRIFRLLSEVPTDHLSRHPYMSAVYKQELRELYAVRKAHYAREGMDFTQDDLRELERQARLKALANLKRTLWDVSAHSHGAHVMRFLSPFFAAHQEALTRWWRIASDDPSIVRKFQLAFDAPRKMGMTYDSSTGELVEEGEGPSVSHQLLLRVPFAGDNAAVNKWLKKMGGGKYWRVNENGFNLILQNGIANPGVGPVVTVPMESLVNKYASEPEIEKMARILNPYPPDSPGQSLQPAWTKRAMALIQGPGNKEWGRRYNANLADAIIKFRLDHGEAVPTEAQFDAIAERAAHDTNRDLGLMMLSNLTSPLPAKPESKYAVVQHGISKILSQMRSGGHDFNWAREQVTQKYGDIYTALLYSQTTNRSKLSQTYAEVDAIKKHKGVLGRTDPTLARMIVGPEAAMDAEADPGKGKYSAAARRFLLNEKVSPTSTETYLAAKEPDEAGVASLIDAGWTQYEELTNWLQVQAEQQGLKTYEDSDELVAAKQAGIRYLKDSNYAWAHEWDSYDHGAGYTELLNDMRQIATDKKLTSDPTRQDVYWLGQYIEMRDLMTEMLEQRKAAGGAGSMEAKSNEDIRAAFTAGVQYIRQQNTFWDTYMYHGIIERDPYLLATSGDD